LADEKCAICGSDQGKYVCIGCGRYFCKDCGESKDCFDIRGIKGSSCKECLGLYGTAAESGGFGEHAGRNAVKDLHMRLKQSIIPDLNQILDESTVRLKKVLDDGIDRSVDGVTRILSQSGDVVSETSQLVVKTNQLVKSVSGVAESILPRVEKIAAAAEDRAMTSADLSTTLAQVERIISQLEPYADRIEHTLESWWKDKEEDRRLGIAATARNAVLVFGFGIFFYLASLWQGEALTTYAILRIGWAALSIPALLILLPTVISTVWGLKREVPRLTWAVIRSQLPMARIGAHLFTILVVVAVWGMFLLMELVGVHTVP
jgi:hypothetical protein